MNYAVKAIACNPTCLNPNAPEECSLPKIENCVCADSNDVIVEGECVSAMTCGCTDDNGIHHEVNLHDICRVTIYTKAAYFQNKVLIDLLYFTLDELFCHQRRVGRLSITQLLTSVIGIPISSYHFGTSSSHRFRGLPLGRFPILITNNDCGYSFRIISPDEPMFRLQNIDKTHTTLTQQQRVYTEVSIGK